MRCPSGTASCRRSSNRSRRSLCSRSSTAPTASTRRSRPSSRSSPTTTPPSFARARRSALEEVVLRLKEALDLVAFYTVGDADTRAWTLRRGQTALDAAAAIHTDIARGFIRCEVILADDLLACGSHAEAARRGLQRLEGKTYVVQDGDVLNIRGNFGTASGKSA